MEGGANQQPDERIDRGTWLALIAMGIAVFVIANDFSAINVVIPSIEQDFETTVDTAQWVVNAYALTFGVLIVTGGRLADLFGRRRMFFAGSAIFASMSLAGALAPTEAILIAALDNLVKGASGQAIQNMNIQLGLPEATGLGQRPLFP